MTAPRLKELSLIDEIITEPLGGAHRNVPQMAESIKQQILAQLDELSLLPIDDLLERRYQRLLSYGYC